MPYSPMSISSESESVTPVPPTPAFTPNYAWFMDRRQAGVPRVSEGSPSAVTTPTITRKPPPSPLDLTGCKLPELHMSPPNARTMVQTPRGTVIKSAIVPNGDKHRLAYNVPAGGSVLVYCERDAVEIVRESNLTRTAMHPIKMHLERDGPRVLRVLSRGLVFRLHRYEVLDLNHMGIDNETTACMRAALFALLAENSMLPA